MINPALHLLKELLNNFSSETKFTWWSAKDNSGFLNVLYSTDKRLTKNTKQTVYECQSLIRVLGRKNKIFSDDLDQELYLKIPTEVAVIKDWNEYNKEVLIINFEDVPESKLKQTYQKVQIHKTKLCSIFTELKGLNNE